MALALKQEEYTIEDIYNLPEGERAELIDGQMYMMGAPIHVHQRIISELSYAITDYIKRKGGDCQVNMGPYAVYLDGDDKTYVEPDISVICDRSKIIRGGYNGAPDWIIEVISPGSERMDRSIKYFKYLSAGVREYWIVDPDIESVLVWNFENNTAATYTFQQMIPVGIYGDLKIEFSKMDIYN